MINLAKRKTLYLWIAMLAILFGALAPTVSHALAAGQPQDGALMLCTVNGYQMIQPPADGGKAPPDAKSMQHCAFCSLHGGADALPPAPAVAHAPGAGRAIHPPLFHHAPRAQHVWSAAQQRAPPFPA